LGAEGRRFESCIADHIENIMSKLTYEQWREEIFEPSLSFEVQVDRKGMFALDIEVQLDELARFEYEEYKAK
jgi:hypothetical protein